MAGTLDGRIVVTGFRSFPGVPDNPSQRVVEALEAASDLLPASAECLLLDTAYAAIPHMLDAVLEDPPAALVLTGYSALAEGFKLERRASERCSPKFADAFGFIPPEGFHGTASAQENRSCDFPELERQLQAEGISCHLSDDAGEYVCNHLYHAALARIARLGLPTRAVFVHLPALEGTPLAKTSASAMPLMDMARGVSRVARLLAGE